MLDKARAKLDAAGDEDRQEMIDLMEAIRDAQAADDAAALDKARSQIEPICCSISRPDAMDDLSDLPREAERCDDLPAMPCRSWSRAGGGAARAGADGRRAACVGSRGFRRRRALAGTRALGACHAGARVLEQLVQAAGRRVDVNPGAFGLGRCGDTTR